MPRDETAVDLARSGHVRQGALAPQLTEAATVLAKDVPHLVRESFELAKVEAKATARSVAVRAGLIATFGIFAVLGLFFACAGASIAISQLTETAWAGPVVVGGFLLIVALIGTPLALKAGGTEEEESGKKTEGQVAPQLA